MLRVLGDFNADLSAPKDNGFTPVYVGAQENHPGVIRVLHSLSCDLEAANNDGATPVYISACNGHVESIKVLHELGASVNTPNNNFATPAYIGDDDLCVLVAGRHLTPTRPSSPSSGAERSS